MPICRMPSLKFQGSMMSQSNGNYAASLFKNSSKHIFITYTWFAFFYSTSLVYTLKSLSIILFSHLFQVFKKGSGFDISFYLISHTLVRMRDCYEGHAAFQRLNSIFFFFNWDFGKIQRHKTDYFSHLKYTIY